jgi:hypothetical protein
MKQQTCWTILRHFNYDDQLRIKGTVWESDKSLTDTDLNKNYIELSKDAISYLKRLFDAFKIQPLNKLDINGLEKIFATTEKGMPWKVKMETAYDNGIIFDNWIGLWQKFFSTNPKEAFVNLVYIGYCGLLKEAI